MAGIDTQGFTVFTRSQISSRAWELARWIDGRRVIVAPLLNDMAMQSPQCRVMPSVQRFRGMYPYDKPIGPEPHEEAIVTTWESVALRLMEPLPIYGIPLGDSDETA